MPTSVSSAILRIVAAGEPLDEQSETENFRERLKLRRQSAQGSPLAVAELTLPATGAAIQDVVATFAAVRPPWELFLLAHGTSDGLQAAGMNGSQLGVLVTLILNQLQKPDLLSVRMLICYAGRRQDKVGVAGRFTVEMFQRGHDLLVVASPHKLSVDLAGEVFNPEGMTMLSAGPENPVQELQFDFDSGALRVE